MSNVKSQHFGHYIIEASLRELVVRGLFSHGVLDVEQNVLYLSAKAYLLRYDYLSRHIFCLRWDP